MIGIGSLVECIRENPWINYGTGRENQGPDKGEVLEVIAILEHPFHGVFLEFSEYSPQSYDINDFRELDVLSPGEVEELVEESCCVPIELFSKNGV